MSSLYKVSPCKIFWLCAVAFIHIYTVFYSFKINFIFFYLSNCKSNTPLTNFIMNLSKNPKVVPWTDNVFWNMWITKLKLKYFKWIKNPNFRIMFKQYPTDIIHCYYPPPRGCAGGRIGTKFLKGANPGV